MKNKFLARVKFLSTAEGGYSRAPLPGIRPQIKVQNLSTSCVVHPLIKQPMKLGQEHDVQIEILFWDQCSHLFTNDMEIELQEGSRVIGRGKFLEDISSSARP